MADYPSIYSSMEEDKWYTAAELGVAAASLNAMNKRGMVEVLKGKPNQYRKIKSVLPTILSILSKEKPDFFTLYRKKGTVGMLCSLKNNQILDCWGKPYPIINITYMTIETKEFYL